jgi:hypothetical protein
LIEPGERNFLGALEVVCLRKEQPKRAIVGALVLPEFLQQLRTTIVKGANDRIAPDLIGGVRLPAPSREPDGDGYPVSGRQQRR